MFYSSRVCTNTKNTPKYSPKHIQTSLPPLIPVGIMEITEFNVCVFYIEGNMVETWWSRVYFGNNKKKDARNVEVIDILILNTIWNGVRAACIWWCKYLMLVWCVAAHLETVRNHELDIEITAIILSPNKARMYWLYWISRFCLLRLIFLHLYRIMWVLHVTD